MLIVHWKKIRDDLDCTEHAPHNPHVHWRRVVANAILSLFARGDRQERDIRQMRRALHAQAVKISGLEALIYELTRPRVIGLVLKISLQGEDMATKNIKASALWSDGFVGFDSDVHAQPGDWDVTFTTDGDAGIEKTGADTATLTTGGDFVDDVIVGSYGAFSAEFDLAAPPRPVVNGIRIDEVS